MVLGEAASGHVSRWLADKTCNSKTSACALRHPATGEAAPVGDRYNKEPIPDEDWWLRGNNRAKLLTTAPFTFYDGNPLGKKNFQAQCVGPDHSRRVAQQLGRIGHSFSEANLQVLKEDPTARRYMSHRYAELMGSVGHCSRSTPWLPGTERLERRPKASAYAPANNAPSAPANAPNAANAAKLPTVKLPKAEMRRTMDGSTIVVLPNPRLPRGQESLGIHSPSPPIHGRPKFSYTLDYTGERLVM
ncbi:unnamed protein product [Effrenium voratum]|nr:unnamed protein product [Effrenium voratum]